MKGRRCTRTIQFIDNAGFLSFLESNPLPDTVHSLIAEDGPGVSFSEGCLVSRNILARGTLNQIKKLELNLSREQETEVLFDFLNLFPAIENLVISGIVANDVKINAIKNLVLSAQSLLAVKLAFSSARGTTLSFIHDFYVALATKTELTSMTIIDTKYNSPPLSLETVISVLATNHTCSSLIVNATATFYPKEPRFIEAFNANKALGSFWFRALASDLVAEDHDYYRMKRGDLWTDSIKETRDLLKTTRILSAIKRSQTQKLPTEVIEQILTCSIAQNSMWIKDQLDVIIKCLRDRRTLGKVHSDVVDLDKNVLFVRCKRALAQLE